MGMSSHQDWVFDVMDVLAESLNSAQGVEEGESASDFELNMEFTPISFI